MSWTLTTEFPYSSFDSGQSLLFVISSFIIEEKQDKNSGNKCNMNIKIYLETLKLFRMETNQNVGGFFNHKFILIGHAISPWFDFLTWIFRPILGIPCLLNIKQRLHFPKSYSGNAGVMMPAAPLWLACHISTRSPFKSKAKPPFPGAFLIDMLFPFNPSLSPRRPGDNKWTSQKQFQLFQRKK